MKRPTYKQLLATAKARTKTQPDGSYNEEDLIVSLESLITLDVEAEKKRIAKSIIDSETKPGSTESAGSLYLPGMEPYDYEPERLIRDEEGHVIEQDKSTARYKFAESHRAAKHSQEAAEWANRKREEVELYAQWVLKQRDGGRTENLTFGDFIRESGLFTPTAAAA